MSLMGKRPQAAAVLLVEHAVNSGQHARLCVARDLDDPLALLSLSPTWIKLLWLVGCFGFNDPLRQYFSLYRAASERERERGEKG